MTRFIKEAILMARLKFNRLRTYPKYEGPLIDSMMQIGDRVLVESIDQNMKDLNITHMALFARQQEPEDSTQHVLAIKKVLGDRIVLGTPKRFDQQDDLTLKFVKDTLQDVKNGAKFIGELHFAHADKYPPSVGCEVTIRGERYVYALGPNVLKLMDALDGKGIPVFVHWEMYHWDRDWPAFDELFSRYPNINFIWAHAGYGKPMYSNEILNKHKNVYITLSKRDLFFFKRKWVTKKGYKAGAWSIVNLDWQDLLGSSILDPDGQIYHEWWYLIKRYSNRFLFATDSHKVERWDTYKDIISDWREILGTIPGRHPKGQKFLEDIAYKNAEKLFGITHK